MVSHEEMVRNLNEDFEMHLRDMKPHVLQLQLKSERQRCALWIKKLCEPHQHSGLEGRKLRNSYSKALLNMLKKGIMEGPLLHRPPDSKLDPFPGYLDEYLREVEEPEMEQVPDWLADLDDQSSITGGAAGDFGEPKMSSTNRRAAADSGAASDRVRTTRNAARERLEELLASQPPYEEFSDAGERQHREDEQTQRTRGSPNKRRSNLTVTFPSRRGPTRPTDRDGLARVTDIYTSPLDEITNRRTAEGAASFQFSSDEEEQTDSDRRYNEVRDSSDGQQRDLRRDQERRTSPDRPTQRRSGSAYRSSSSERRRTRSPVRASSIRSPVRSTRLSRSPVYIREQTRTLERNFDREVDMKVKIIENQLHEDKLKQQHKNDEEIQKILERKNSEIDEVKTQYRSKLEKAEEEVTKLEKKVQGVLRDAAVIRENKDQQIQELKKLAEESQVSKNNTMEKKYHDMQTEHEQEKIELQKAQTASIQQLMDDTNERLIKMEDDYRKQSKQMADTIRELEKRIQVLTLDAEKVSSAKQNLEQTKIELESRVEQLTSDYSEYKIRYEQLDREHKKTLDDHHHSSELTKEKHDSQLNFARKEHQLTVTKDNDTIMSLEQQIVQLKQNIQDLEAQRQRQVRELEQTSQQDKQHAENLHDKKVRSLQKEMEQQESENKKKIRALEKVIAEREKDVNRLQEKITSQAAQAEASLQELRTEVEKQQNEVFAQMKVQMQQVESELESSKSARREQTDEFERQVKDIAAAHEQQLKSLSAAQEDEKDKLQSANQQQRDLISTNHKQELELLKKNHKSEKEHLEKKVKDRKADSEAKINDLSEQIHELKEELAQSENLRKQQLMEIGLVKEEETQRARHEHERAMERCKSECEREKHTLQKQHSVDLENTIDKTNTKLLNIEKDYTERLSQQAEQIADLKLQLEQSQADKHRLTDQLESKIVDNSNRYDDEKRMLRKQSASNVMSLKQEIELLKTKVRQSERNSENLLADHEEDLVQLRLEYEEKMRGLIPSDAKEQLEATVNSLKNQVNTLKQRIAILQDN